MTNTLHFSNGISFSLLLDDERFLGIGDVRYAETALRDAVLPWTLYTESETGFRFDEFVLREIEQEGETVTLVLSAPGRWLPRMQETDAMGDARLKTRRVVTPTATVRWQFRPISEKLYETTWSGLAMQVHFSCPGHPIHWLIEDTTWEIGGQAAGCTVIQQDITSGPLELTMSPDCEFTTAEQFKFQGAPITPMDTLVRGAGACICDFQVKDDLALCVFMQPPGITRARMEKFAEENVVHYTDRPFFALTETAACPERKLLVYQHPHALARHEYRNLWLDCFTDIRRRFHEVYDFQLEVPVPMVGSHLWNGDLDKLEDRWTEQLIDALPEYARLGYKVFYPHMPWVGTSDDPAYPFARNICCNYDFLFSEKFGGAAGMKSLCDTAHQHGLHVIQWVAFELHSWSPLWKQHPEWVLKQASGDPWHAKYAWAEGALWCGRMRGGFREHLYERLKAAREHTGLDAYFWDSYGNLGQTGIDWGAPDKAPQGEDIWHFQAELQKLGISQRCEMATIFGVANVGMFGFDPQAFTKRQWQDVVSGDQAFVLLDLAPVFFVGPGEDQHTAGYRDDRINGECYFWLAAHRCVPCISARPWSVDLDGNTLPSGPASMPPGGLFAEAFGRVNHRYNAVLPYMHRMRLTPGGQYVLWLDADNQPAVIWDFADTEAPYTGPVQQIGAEEAMQASGAISLQGGSVYLLGNATVASSEIPCDNLVGIR